MRRTTTLCVVLASFVAARAPAVGAEDAPFPIFRITTLPTASNPAPGPTQTAPATPEQPTPPDPSPPEPAPAPVADKHDSPPPADPFPVHVPETFGDQAPISSLLLPPGGSGAGKGALYVPSARYFKIGDNDSPLPQTRSYFSFNYFYNLDGAVNQLAGGGIQHIRIHREIWGCEWADEDHQSSVGLRLPLATYNAANTVPWMDGTSTDLGDLSIIFKRVVWEDCAKGALVSVGLAVTPPTGPGSFAGSNYLKVFHTTGLQPFCGWVWSREKFYLQGFTAVDAPTDLNDVVLLTNDLAAGYFLYQQPNGRGLTAVVPTVELHVNTPLNHRGVLSLSDPAGTPDSVNLTAGVHCEYQDKSSFGVAFAVPVTGPRLFDFEILAQFRVRY
jgi:hypothetical protein